MLQSTFCPVIPEALNEANTIEVMANPDGSIWIEKALIGIVVSKQNLTPNDRERVIKLVASSIRQSIDTSSPIISAELPGTGERFEDLLPPILPFFKKTSRHTFHAQRLRSPLSAILCQ